MYVVYVIQNTRGQIYTGSTGDMNKRLEMHNNIEQAKARFHRTTYKKGPWKLVWSQEFETRLDAVRFEKYLKTGTGREWLERARRGE